MAQDKEAEEKGQEQVDQSAGNERQCRNEEQARNREGTDRISLHGMRRQYERERGDRQVRAVCRNLQRANLEYLKKMGAELQNWNV